MRRRHEWIIVGIAGGLFLGGLLVLILLFGLAGR